MVQLYLFTLLIIVTISSHVNSNVEVTSMIEMLDAMQLMMTGEEEFNREFYKELIDCMNFIDPAIQPSQQGAWQGIINYWDTRGTVDDPWGQRKTNYLEQNVTTTALRGMTIYEPCNYASNVAYYYPVTEMCNRFINGTTFSMSLQFIQSMAKGFSQLAMGSSFMHGSHTSLGSQQDNKPLAALAYQLHQASLNPLQQSPILHDLDQNYREFTALDIITNLDNMYTNMPVTEWKSYTDSLFIPNYYLIYSGIVCSVLTLTLSPDVVDVIVPVVANAFDISDEILSFIEDSYLPELRNATAEVDLNIFQRTRLIGNAIGTFIKLIYAFLWQERILTDSPLLLTPEASKIGMELLPEVNRVASSIQTYDHFNQDFQNGIDIYPGDMNCNPVLPHCKWHLESAIGLLDMVYLTDEVHKILATISVQHN